MTGLGVERTPRTAYPRPSAPPAGASALMPPHIQGAERRTEGRARGTGFRWSLRALVIGGLAGAAWLLTGAAAHAADRADGPAGPLLGSVVAGDATTPVTGLLKAAAQPLETAHPAKHVVAHVLELPRRVVTRPARTLTEVAHGHSGTAVDAALGGVDLVLREVAGPLRLTGGPTLTQQRLTAVTDLVAAVSRPVTGRPWHPAVTPVHAAPHPVATASRVRISKTFPSPAAQRAGAPTAVLADGARVALVRAGALVHRASVRSLQRHSATAAEPAGADLPGGPDAPVRLHLGDVSGTSTGGSGNPTEGGSAAFLPAAIVASTMARHRLQIATDVEVRRHDAEAPTASPD